MAKLYLAILLCLFAAVIASAGKMLTSQDMPEGDCVSPRDGIGEVQFAADHQDLSPEKAAALRSVQRRFLGYTDQFADGSETYYDEYAQAWRLVGFYVDCNAQDNDDRRQLEQGDGASACKRYLLWAAVSETLSVFFS